ncbi:MAG: class I SAM-dependent methyltransferase [Dehalococcoidia bacterium]|nr:class I SAM-dependent methyltransferase [Dehalococcoidia bacterium]
MQANRALWDELTNIHSRSSFYDVGGFKKGKSTLSPIEVGEVSDVRGKLLLHLQCHFGLDTISWARMGAKATGVDFSERAITLARKLARETGSDAKFICANVYDIPQLVNVTFDLVFTSYGALCWLPDVRRWAKTVAQFVKPGGTFYIVDFHPFTNLFVNNKDARDFQVAYSYFHSAEPAEEQMEGSYADPNARVRNTSRQWTHSLSDIVNALLGAGLRIQFLHEFPYCTYAHFPFLKEGPDGLWRVPGRRKVPLLFSIKAVRDGPPAVTMLKPAVQARSK